MLLQHPATYDIVDLKEVMNVTSLEQLVKNIVSYGGNQDSDVYEPLSYMGDCWEVFAEFFFKFFNGDHTLTYTADYEPNMDYDRGIDGRGVSTLDMKPCVIQHKFKANPTKWLTNEDNISNIVADAVINEELVPNDKNIIIFTSCKGVHPKHAMANVHCISVSEISRRVNQNQVFWYNLQQVIEETTNVIEK
jgi:hypothetical protein